QIGFNYISAAKEGPVISDVRPAGGTVYQKNVGLIITTDKPADCRYSDKDVDFDEMQESFSTSDGSLYQATVALDSFGTYVYYVRCKDKEGNKDTKSEVINFEYKENPDSEEVVNDTNNPDDTEKTEVICTEIKPGDKDGACDPTRDCVCDPDCPASGDDADSDCANAAPAPQPNNAWVAVVIIGLLLLIIVVVIIVIIKKRGSDEEDVELP
ncbi:MAG: hypothetical protein WCX69_03555, partial [Candidatus Paceibacterota bacterium]